MLFRSEGTACDEVGLTSDNDGLTSNKEGLTSDKKGLTSNGKDITDKKTISSDEEGINMFQKANWQMSVIIIDTNRGSLMRDTLSQC